MRRHLTYANVMATVAAFLAVAGGSTAIAISANNKAPKNSVTSKAIKAGNVTAGDLAGVRVATSGVTSAYPNPAQATCSAKEKLIGGGARGVPTEPFNPNLDLELEASYPDGNTWKVFTGRAGNGSAEAYALCLKAKPGA